MPDFCVGEILSLVSDLNKFLNLWCLHVLHLCFWNFWLATWVKCAEGANFFYKFLLFEFIDFFIYLFFLEALCYIMFNLRRYLQSNSQAFDYTMF